MEFQHNICNVQEMFHINLVGWANSNFQMVKVLGTFLHLSYISLLLTGLYPPLPIITSTFSSPPPYHFSLISTFSTSLTILFFSLASLPLSPSFLFYFHFLPPPPSFFPFSLAFLPLLYHFSPTSTFLSSS